MTPARTRAALTAAVLASLLSASAFAQPSGPSQLCRVRWEEQTWGGDTLGTTGVITLDRAAPQADGSIYFMGMGRADIVFRPGGACQATSGGQVSANLMAIVSSEDGQTATVDITPVSDATFPVVVQCGPQRSEMEVGVSTPPSVELPLRDGATAPFSNSSRSTFDSGGTNGTVTLEFCQR